MNHFGMFHARLPAIWSICTLGLGVSLDVSAQSDWTGFHWKTAQSGSFSTPSSWAVSDERFMVKPFVDSTATIPPRAGDGVLFPSSSGAYTVDLAGAPSLLLFYFHGTSQASFVLAGGLAVDEFFTATSGTITFRGGGSLTAAKFCYVGGQMVLEGIAARCHGVPLAGSWSSVATNAHRLSFSPDGPVRLFRMLQP